MNPKTILFIILTLYSFFFMDKTVKNTQKDGPLTKNEKIQVILLLIFNTVFSWLIFYFGWKSKLPTKAKQVNSYIKRILLWLVGIGIAAIVLSAVLVAINPRAQIRKANEMKQLQKN